MKKITRFLFVLLAASCGLGVNAQTYVTTVSPGTVYSFISCSNAKSGYYMYDAGSALYINQGKTESDSTTNFMFENSATEGWYYLKNVATGNYLQKMAEKSGTNLPVSPTKYKADTTLTEIPSGWIYSVNLYDTADVVETDSMWYILKGAGSYPSFVYADTARNVVRALPGVTTFNNSYMFQLVTVDSLLYLKSKLGLYLGLSGATSDNGAKIPLVSDRAQAATFTVEMLDATTGKMRFTSSNDPTTKYLHMQGSDSVCYWSGSGAQSQLFAYKARIDSVQNTEVKYDTTITYSEAEIFQVAIANEDQMWIKSSNGYYLNMYFGAASAEGDNGITYWHGSGDASRWHILKVKDSGDNMAELKALIDAVSDYISRMDSAGKMGYYAVDAYTELDYQYEEAKGVYEYEGSTYNDIAVSINLLGGALNDFLATGVVKPEADKYYRIRNLVYNNYAAMTDTAGILLSLNPNDPRTVWQFTPDSAGYYIKNVWLNVNTINATPMIGLSPDYGSTWSLFNKVGDGRFQIHILKAYLTVPGSYEYWAASADSVLYSYSSVPESYWVIEECELPTYNYDDWTNKALKVSEAQASPAVAGVKYYNLMGIAADKSAKGLLIRRTIYSDGSVKSEKIYVK